VASEGSGGGVLDKDKLLKEQLMTKQQENLEIPDKGREKQPKQPREPREPSLLTLTETEYLKLVPSWDQGIKWHCTQFHKSLHFSALSVL